jgi:hypothetical protein
MNNLWINWRFGSWHLQIGPDRPYVTIKQNPYWLEHEPPCWFERM